MLRVKLYIICEVEYRLELFEDVVVVSRMKFIILVVVLNFVKLNSDMKGFILGMILCYGMIVVIVSRVNM